jgi:hypothetical protein
MERHRNGISDREWPGIQKAGYAGQLLGLTLPSTSPRDAAKKLMCSRLWQLWKTGCENDALIYGVALELPTLPFSVTAQLATLYGILEHFSKLLRSSERLGKTSVKGAFGFAGYLE